MGAFATKYLWALEEVQLHSMAGRSSDSRVLQKAGKLPILMAALLATIDLDLESSGDIKKLTFSASGAAHLYEALGFQHSDRAGIVIKPV